MGTEGIHRLHTDTIQADALLEGLAVIFSARVEHRDGLDELALGDAAAIVAHTDAQLVIDINLNARTGIHLCRY